MPFGASRRVLCRGGESGYIEKPGDGEVEKDTVTAHGMEEARGWMQITRIRPQSK